MDKNEDNLLINEDPCGRQKCSSFLSFWEKQKGRSLDNWATSEENKVLTYEGSRI